MASRLKTSVTGRKAILEALRDLDDEADDIVVEAVSAGGEVFRAEVHSRAPIGDGTKQPAGTMKRKIRLSIRKKTANVSAHVITPPEAVFTEYGFLHRNSGKRIPAEPWIRPAFEAKAPGVEKEALDTMLKGIEAVARRKAGPDA